MSLNGTRSAAQIAATASKQQGSPGQSRDQIGMAGLAVFLLGAMAFVNPAMARECEDTCDLVRQAVKGSGLAAEQSAGLGARIDQALNLHAGGDEPGCLAALAEARALLARI